MTEELCLTLDQEALLKMNSDELVKLARALKIPLTQRSVTRTALVGKILDIVDKNAEETFGPSEPLSDPAIDIRGLTKRFGATIAVDDLTMTVSPGEIVGLVGPNGAGKTTTLRVVTGIIRPTKGSVSVGGHDVIRSPISAKKLIGYIPEKPTCYPNLTVREYLMFMARIHGVSTAEAAVRMTQYQELFQLGEYLDNYVGTLSKGNLQRTLLVGIFIRRPPYVLAFDEPIYGLDPRGAWSLKAHLHELKESGSAILLSTHILEVAQSLCDRFVIMNEGIVVGRGTLDELLTEAKGATNLEEVFLELTGGIPGR
ncbi:MAG: ABC transporter ATP-binding protein [Candidatus Thorarchaeota archaeon]